ncbi:putative ABC transporter [Trypanosoma rangeli]|uniref:Putative ABC transporter n=1 Tax=Trypanosoma rangeli TaxID=5698 RepID=A0A3R7KK16_TRYRA|nr:putative ABC transporter [Trypanosoma rangeli]RNF08025.1 putative ABC transporter [Trypanosoma rangeli]|eukprot:RNF08025.1 putative ABC transporter [Trypanosoma rangeli]
MWEIMGIVGLLQAGATVMTVFCLLPPTSFSITLGILFCYELMDGLTLRDVCFDFDGPNMGLVLGITVPDFFLYLLLTAYVEAVTLHESGTPKHPLFFVIDPWRRCRGRVWQWGGWAGPEWHLRGDGGICEVRPSDQKTTSGIRARSTEPSGRQQPLPEDAGELHLRSAWLQWRG